MGEFPLFTIPGSFCYRIVPAIPKLASVFPIGTSPFSMPQPHMGQSSIVVSGGKFWVNIYGVVVVKNGILILPFFTIGIPPTKVGVSIPRVYLYARSEIRNSLVIFAFIVIGIASTKVGVSIPWVYLYDRCKIRDSLVIFTSFVIGKSPINVSLSIPRV